MGADPVRRVPVEGQRGFHRVSLDEGAVLFEAGAPADCLYLVEAGRVAMVDGESGAIFGSPGPGEAFGEQAILRGGVRGATARAEAPSTLLEIPAAGLRQTLEGQKTAVQALFHCAMLELSLWNQGRQGVLSAEEPFSVPLERFMLGHSRAQLQHILQQEGHELSVPEFLLLKLVLNPKLHTLALTKEVALKQALFSHGQALVLTHGAVIFEAGGQRVFGGPGTVLGLASGLCRLPPFEVALAGSVNALALPLERLLGELDGMNAGILAVLRSIILRTLGVSEAPAGLVAPLAPKRNA